MIRSEKLKNKVINKAAGHFRLSYSEMAKYIRLGHLYKGYIFKSINYEQDPPAEIRIGDPPTVTG